MQRSCQGKVWAAESEFWAVSGLEETVPTGLTVVGLQRHCLGIVWFAVTLKGFNQDHVWVYPGTFRVRRGSLLVI